MASLGALRCVALSPPTGSRRSCSRSAARRQLRGMPERCSPARVRFAAPKTGAPLPAPRRSGGRQLRRAAPTGTRSSSRFGSMNLNSKNKERKSAATRPPHFPTPLSLRSEPISCSSFDWKMLKRCRRNLRDVQQLGRRLASPRPTRRETSSGRRDRPCRSPAAPVPTSSSARATFTRLPFSSPRNIWPPPAPQQNDRSRDRRGLHYRRRSAPITSRGSS